MTNIERARLASLLLALAESARSAGVHALSVSVSDLTILAAETFEIAAIREGFDLGQSGQYAAFTEHVDNDGKGR